MAPDPLTEMNTYRSYVTMLADPTVKDELKLKVAKELSENFEAIMCSQQSSQFFDHMIKIFLKTLQEGEPHFISEYNIQQVRKLILEMIHRLPNTEQLRQYVRPILSLVSKLLEKDNEENVLVCLRIIIELHRQFKPTFNPEIQYFLQFVKLVYSELPKNLSKIFEPRPPLRVKDLSELNIEALLKETFTITAIQSEKKTADGTLLTYNLIPKAVLSLKVLQELPIIVVFMNQLYKQNVHQDVSDFVPIVIKTISLQPSPQHRASPGFNKEVFVDFMGAQIKTLSFLAYVIRIHQDLIAQHSTMLVKGLIGLYTLCPMEVAHLRKELVVASRHILATDLRNHFVPHMEVFFNEDIFIGRGWTAHETLRPLAYSTLADLVHHVRLQLPLNDVSKAVHLYGKNVLDQTLPTAVQMVSCKLLMNLVDTVRQRFDAENSSQGRELLMRILLVFVLKFKTIAKIYIPILRNKMKQLKPAAADTEETKPCIELNEEKEPPKSKFGFPTSQAMSYNIAEHRNLVKSLVHGAKAITSNCINISRASQHQSSEVTQSPPLNQFQPKETLIYIQFVKWALPTLDIYTIGPAAVGAPMQPIRSMPQPIRTREEKEVLELFGNVFTQMSPQSFHEIFSVTIDYMVERIFKNCALQIIGSAFLSSPAISSTFATILVEYLLERMSDMGSNIERSNLYLRLFKLVFGSVSLFPAENEHMLRPHLNQVVNRAMDLAMTAKEPYNYFLLLRALFRSIGGGSHDLLYQEFLPLLPNMLEGLNRLQSGLHRQHMKDLFVELCLTVPVRLSSLLPYLPMLMDPLVSALNGSSNLVSQGLRTLELCVDNLQPDFLYEHIQPVRSALMQALWRTLHGPQEQAVVALRVLGKFGGGNRRMMIEPQKLEYNDRETSSPNVIVYFQGPSQPIDFPVEKVIEAAFNALKSSATDVFYRKQCWEVIYCYLTASLMLNDSIYLWYRLFGHPSFKEDEISHQQNSHYKCPDTVARNVQLTALTGMFVATEIKELKSTVLNTVAAVVRHYTMIAIALQCGLFHWKEREIQMQGQDPLVLIDALALIMSHDERELYRTGYLALMLILETATSILGSKERACRLPFMEYLAEKMCSLCYERAWYAKMGGCIAIKFLYERMATKWVLNHLFTFLKALLFVMMDLTDEVSNGSIDLAKEYLDKMLRICVNLDIRESNTDVTEAHSKSLNEVTRELVKQVTSPHTIVREQAMASLRLLAELQNKSVTEVMEPHKDVLADMIPPKKHLLKHQPANAQIGLMDGNTFCTTLNPRLFTVDVNISEHETFFKDLINLCELDEASISKLACYKSVSNLMPLRKSALRALAACHYVAVWRDKILSVLYKALEKSNAELQETAFECMKMFTAGFQVDIESVHTMMRPMLLTMGDHRNLSLNCVRRLSYLTQLFPSIFSVTLCEQLLQHLKKLFETLIQSPKSVSKSGEIEQKITTIIGIYHEIPAATPKFIDSLCKLVLQTEKSLSVEISSPFKVPLMKFLLRYPTETLNLFLRDNNIKDQQWSKYLEYLIRHKDGKPFRDSLHNSTERLMMLLTHSQMNTNLTHAEKSELQYRAIKIIGILVRFDEQWLSTQSQLVNALKQIWCNDEYQALHKKVEGVDYCHWKEPKHIVKILLHYFRHQPNEIDLLFQLLRATCNRFVPDFQFLRDFLENTVAQEYTVEWKRNAFFRFVEHFPSNSMSQELKANILQLIVIPCFAVSFERGEGTKLVGGPPMPYVDDPENVVSVFINKVIDPDNPFGSEDCVRISLLQFSRLIVEQASQHIHDVTNKKQGNKLRRLMTFAWPCLLGKNCVDPTTRYHGHLLLSHIIASFAIHKRIVLQVFHSLLKAHAVDARNVVRQALEILTPAMPVRMEDGNTMLTHWTKKIIVEEGHSIQQLVHILQLVVRHYKVYYPVRHHLVQHIVNSIQRMGFSSTASMEHRRLAVELAEVIIKWELCRIKEEAETTESNVTRVMGQQTSLKRPIAEDPSGKRFSAQSTSSGNPVPIILPKTEPGSTKPIERAHADSVLNFLVRLACQVNDVASIHGNPGEQLSRRCLCLLKMALKPDVWAAEQCDLKLAWLDKVLASIDGTQPNYGNICTALEVLTFLLSVMKRDQILVSFKPLQHGIGACIASTNTKVIRLVHALLSRLMTIFPPEPTPSNAASKLEELDTLYVTVSRFIADGLTTYEKTTTATPSSLFGTLMTLKAACTNNPNYIDRLITPFMRVLHRMTKEHLHCGQAEANAVTSDMLVTSLDLVKNRVAVMGVDMRKSFIGTILISLIEKTQDAKVMKAITRILEEWMKNKSTIAINQAPTLREKSILLSRMAAFVEKRFPDDHELNKQFLELVNYVYRDESLKLSELSNKLEPAFLAGLRCVQPQVRAKFFEVFDESIKRRLQDRILYILCSQNWDNIGPYYWIKQCIELLLATANPATQIRITNQDILLPSVTSIVNGGMVKDHKEQMLFMCQLSSSNEEQQNYEIVEITDDNTKESLIDVEAWMSSVADCTNVNATGTEEITENPSLIQIIKKQGRFIEDAKKVKTEQLLLATAQLCHLDTKLAERVWLDMFPRMWSILDESDLRFLMQEVPPFVASGVHVNQKDCHPSALGTFLEALAHCDPPVAIAPPVMKYLGKSHNVWHRVTLLLEQMAFESDSNSAAKSRLEWFDDEDVEGSSRSYEVMDMLSEMYSLLYEEDMWSGLWQKRPAYYKETLHAIALEQQGFFEQAQGTYDLCMSKFRQDFSINPAPYEMNMECLLWERHRERTTKELNQWEIVLELGTHKKYYDPFLVLESAWRVSNWSLMKDILTQVEHNCPKEMTWKINLYRGYLALCNSEDQHLSVVERYVEYASNQCMREWRRLPHIVSHVHLPLLQAAQQIMELQEAMQIHQGLLHGRSTSLHDMKAIVKTWRNRLPVIADDLSHWSDIFTWRQHHYTFITSHYNSQQDQTSNQALLGVHASMQSNIHFGKIARKHNLIGVCLDSLSKIYTMPNIPTSDCFQKMRQQVKCYLQLAAMGGQSDLQEGLDMLETTNTNYFTSPMIGEYYAWKGLVQSLLGRSDDANKSFSTATQIHDTLKAWAYWGDYLENIFIRDARQISFGVNALVCFLHACRHQDESKTRKYIAKILWLLTYDDDKGSLMETLDKFAVGIPPSQWLPWVPQLLMYLVRQDGNTILNLLSQVGRTFPQAVYFSIRTLYLTLKIERQYNKNAELAVGRPQEGMESGAANSVPETGPTLRAPAPMWRCSRVMHMQRDIHPTILSSLEGIVDQMVWFRETWHEEVLRQLRQGLTKCYALAFENRCSVSEATITPHTLNFVKKLVSTFGIGIENIFPSQNMSSFGSAASESLARRAQATAQDPVFLKQKGQFASDFDFSVPGARLLHNLINKLKKWIKKLEEMIKKLPKSFLIEEKCRFLSNFSLKTAEIELPGEFLIPRHSHYSVKIARFMPRVEVVQLHNTGARRLRIRGHNGRLYPYLVVNDAGLGDARREERLLQVLRMLNHYLTKKKETSRRFLHFTVPRLIAVAPQTRLVEDNPAAISLLEIYKKGCAKLAMEHDAPIARYYEKLAAVQARGAQASHQVLRDILKEVQTTMVAKTMLKDWAIKTFPGATDYWTFRKIFTLQLALSCFAEYALHLTRLNPDMMYVHQDSGLINIAYFKFDIDDTSGELDANRPVPFRLTPNILEFVTTIGVYGPLTASVIATARCLVTPSFQLHAILRAVLRDEVIADHKRQEDAEGTSQTPNELKGELLITMVTRAVNAIVTRLNSLANFDGIDSKVSTLVAAANSHDNLCRMDPSWHPWL